MSHKFIIDHDPSTGLQCQFGIEPDGTLSVAHKMPSRAIEISNNFTHAVRNDDRPGKRQRPDDALGQYSFHLSIDAQLSIYDQYGLAWWNHKHDEMRAICKIIDRDPQWRHLKVTHKRVM